MCHFCAEIDHSPLRQHNCYSLPVISGRMYTVVRAQKPVEGFTLIEAMFSLAIVGVLIICLYSAFTSGFNGVRSEREDARATEILVAKMDQLRLLSWEQITTNGFPDTFKEHYNPDTSTAGANKKDTLIYNGQITLSSFMNDVNYSADMRRVDVDLQWFSLNQRNRSRKLTTYIARFGLQNYVY